MPLVESNDRQRPHLPSLEGIRGYAFLPVFFAHYFPTFLFPYHSSVLLYPMLLVMQLAWLAVPVFFVLSGYLIGGILYDTREREGFFKVFYTRRILRVFPVYYLTLLAIACVDSFRGVTLHFSYWSHFLYIQNLLPGYTTYLTVAPANQTIHFWSLAVEEQFYLLWPLVVWLCRDRRTLLRVTGILIGLCCMLRFAAPWIHMSPTSAYFITPTRVDAILLGVVLALIRKEKIYEQIEPFAKYVALGGVGVMILLAVKNGHRLPSTYRAVAFEIPGVNLITAAIVVAVMEKGSFLCRVCSARWICWLGGLSYGLYVFHLTYVEWFLLKFAPWLSLYMPRTWAFILTGAVAFCLTLLLAMISYRWIEQPAMNLKKRFKYGPVRKPSIILETAEPVLVTGSD